MDLEKDRARYEADRAKDMRLGGTHGIDEVMKAERLDAILFPAASGAASPRKPGYPTVIVPFGFVPNAPEPERVVVARLQADPTPRPSHPDSTRSRSPTASASPAWRAASRS